MKRDKDFVRDLLLKIEGGQYSFDTASDEEANALGFEVDETLSQDEADKLTHHLHIMEQEGFIEIMHRSGGGLVQVKGLTWKGHDFVDTLRDPIIWKKTKDVAAKVGGAGLSALVDIGKGIAKQELQKLGILPP